LNQLHHTGTCFAVQGEDKRARIYSHSKTLPLSDLTDNRKPGNKWWRQSRLDTGNTKTLYLFNLVRSEILEYSREIFEKKLRELKPAGSGFVAGLDPGYKKARLNFKGHSPVSVT